MNRRSVLIYPAVISILVMAGSLWYRLSLEGARFAPAQFDGGRALADVETQTGFGPRTPGSPGHERIRAWMQAELEAAGWVVEIQATRQMGHPVFNLIARRGAEVPQIILGAHYDTRLVADQDPDAARRDQPVPGANDGASGVAVLLELARTLPAGSVPLWLVFFDAEDNGRIEGWDWILGSRAFVESLSFKPQAAVIVDMIGDAGLNIYFERNSDPALRAEIWETAASLGHADVFIARERHSLIDDHTPFVQAGIPAVDIIDFDYPYWHTLQDTPDKVSAESLQAVGETLSAWINAQKQQP